MAQWRISRKGVWLGLVLFVVLVWGASTAQASLISFDMGIEISGATEPEGAAPWLNATFEDSVVVDEVTLTLTVTNLIDNEFVFEWLFNLDPLLDVTNLAFSVPSKTGDFANPTVNTGSNSHMANGDGFFDIQIMFDTSNDMMMRFTTGEVAVFTISGIVGLTADDFDFLSFEDGGQGEYKTAAHVGGIGATDDLSGWIAPEPATLGLLLIGSLGLLRRGRRCFGG